MFLDAIRCDGVPLVKAIVMYQAVIRFGPKWGPGISFTLAPPEMSTDDVVALEAATAQAIAELGEDAELEALNHRIDEILRQSN